MAMIPTNTIVRATLSSFSALTNKYRLLCQPKGDLLLISGCRGAFEQLINDPCDKLLLEWPFTQPG